MRTIKDITIKMLVNQLNDPSIREKITKKVYDLCRRVSEQSDGSHPGYIFEFSIPGEEVLRFYKLMGLRKAEVAGAFRNDWRNKKFSSIYNDPYHLILLLIIYVNILLEDYAVALNALFLILIKIWSNIKTYVFGSSFDEEIMVKAIGNLDWKTELKVYELPSRLLIGYFLPTLSKKYAEDLLLNPVVGLNKLMAQAYTRIFQMFAHNFRIDLNSGAYVPQGGLLVAYQRAKEAMNKNLTRKMREAAERPINKI